MQPNRKNRILVASLTLALTPCAAFATDLYWDTDGTGSAGSGAATGTWGTDLFWSTDPTGANVGAPVLKATTTGVDDLFFSAGTTGTGGTVTVSGSQTARKLTFEEGAITLSGGTLVTLAGGGGITVLTGSGNTTISSNLTVSGNNIINLGSGRTITLNIGTFSRGTSGTVNIQGAGNGSSTMTGLSGNVNNIIGPWASITTSTTTTYAKFTGSSLSGLGYTGGVDGTAATASTSVTSTAGTLNYTLSAAGNLGANANVNTLRYTGGTGALVSNGTFTTRGVMNVGGGTLDIQGTWTSGSSSAEMVINAANGAIRVTGVTSLTGAITKTGSGTLTLGAPAGNNFSGISAITVNQGNFITNASTDNQLVGATINSGGTLTWAGTNKHKDDAVFTINAGGTLSIVAQNDTIGGITGAGTITGTSGFIQIAGTSTFDGNITGGTGIRTSATTSALTLNGVSDYTGATQVNAGSLVVNGNISTSVLTVASGATLGGTGVLGNVTIQEGGKLDLTGATIALDSMNILSLTGSSSLTLGGLTFNDLVGWDWANAADGTYELIDGGFSVAAWGTTANTAGTAYDLGGDKRGYFTGGSLNAVIFTIPEPSTALLGALGLFALLRRRR
jgi:Passenger-associated-transport-repeat